MEKPQRTVLLIEDAPEDREVVRRALTADPDYEYKLHEATTGAEALRLWREQAPDCVLLDYSLPDTNGLKLLAELVADPLQPALPVIMMTGGGDETLAVTALKSGAQDYLIKGRMTANQLRHTISNTIEKVAAQQQLAAQRQQLAESEARFSAAFHNSSAFMSIVSEAEVKYVEVNRACYELFGVKREEVIGRSPADFDFYADPAQRLALRELLNRDGYVHNFEVKWRTKSGEILTHLLNADRITVKGQPCLFVVSNDITTRKEVEEELRASKERLKLGVEVADFAICEIDYTNDTNHLSQEAARLYGLGNEAMTVPREAVHATFHPDDVKELAELIAASLNPEGSGWFAHEHRIVLKNGGVRWLNVRKQIFFDRTANPARPVRSILAARDITERKQAEEQLRLYEKVVVNTKDAVMITEAEPINLPGPRIVYVNPAFTEMTGYTAEEVMGETPRILQGPKTDRKQLDKLRAALENWEPSRVELTDYRKDGSEFEVEFDINPVADETGWFTHWVSIQRDVSERKAAEAKLIEQQELISRQFEEIETVYQTAPVGLAYVDRDLRFVRINEQLAEINGVAVEETVGRTLREVLPENLVDEIEPLYRRVLETGERTLNLEVAGETKAKSGIERAWILNYYPLKDAAGEVIGVNAVVQEITERKRAEENLRVSEERLNLAMTGAQIGAFDWNIKTGAIEWTKETEESAAMPAEAFDNSFEGFIKLIHPLDRELIEKRINDAMEDGDYECEFRMLKGDGTIRWVIGKGRVFFDDNGEPARLVGVDIDITKRKLAEESLLENQLFTQSIIETAPTVLYTFDLKTGSPTYLTNQAATVLGYSFDEVKDDKPDFLRNFMHPEDAKLAENHFRKITQTANGEVFEFEYRMRHKSGEWRWFRSRDRIFKRDENGAAAEILGIALDITERKKALDEIRESDQRMRLATAATNVGVWEWNVLTNQIRWDAQMFSSYGIEPTEDGLVPYTAWSESVLPEELARQEELLQETLLRGGQCNREFHIRRNNDGAIRYIEAVETVRLNYEGQAEWVLGTNLDVTERKLAGDELRASEEFSRTVLESSPDCVKILDGEGRLEYMNANGLCLLEIGDFAPLKNEFWWKLWQDETQPMVKESVEKVLQGETAHFQAFCPTAKGTPKWWDVGVAPVPGKDGKTERIISVSRDITERKRYEMNLSFLANLSVDLTRLTHVDEIMHVISSKIGEYFGADTCAFAEVDTVANISIIKTLWRKDETAVDFSGTYNLSEFVSDDFRRTLQAGKPVVINDVATDERTADNAAKFAPLRIASFINTPYVSDGELKFVLGVWRQNAYEWRTDEIELLEELMMRVWTRIERARAEEHLRTRNHQLDLLAQTSRQLIVGEKSEAEILQTVFDQVATTLGTELYFNFLADNATQTLRLVSSGGLSQEQKDFYATIRFGQFLCGTVAQQRERLIIENLQECEFAEAEGLRQAGAQSYAGFPLIAQGELIGTVAFVARSRAHFRADELQLLQTVCDQVAITLGRARAEEDLRESEARFRTLFDSIDEGFCIVEMIFDERDNPVDYRFVQANPALERLTGMKNALGKTARELVPDLEEFWFATYGKVALTGEAMRFENKSEPMNRWFDVHASRVGAATSRRVAIVFNNITERKLAEAERERLLAQEQEARAIAEAATRAKDDFIAVVSHELRNPLNSIIGYNRLLRQSGPLDSATQDKYLDIIEKNARRQQILIEDLLDTARIISGKLKLDIRPLNFVRVLQDTLDAARPTAETKQITLSVELEESLSLGADITGDSDRLQQVIWNLLSNAIKFTPERGAVIVRLVRAAEQLQLTVMDTGNGLSPELLPHVFDRFRQADSSSTRRHGGLGLGLALVKQLVELHGGTITASSPGEGQGATFTLTLPLRAVLRSEPAAPPPRAAAVNPALLTGLRVLVVDDEPEGREIVRFILSAHGAEVTTVASSTAALAVLANATTKPPDLIVSDIGMPDVDGYELMRQVRQQGLLTPAIAVTAFGRTEDRLRALSAGYQMHVPKPVEAEELLAVVVSLRKRENAGKK